MKFKVSHFIIVIFISIVSKSMPNSTPSAESVFSEIYAKAIWGVNQDGQGWSGSGSDTSTTVDYRKFLQNFLCVYNIKTVIDLGCGDWEFSRLIDWKDIQYLGIDIVSSVIEKNRQQYEKKTIHFMHMNALESELPGAELLICKDVLQHLTNADIIALIHQFKKYRYCLITNGIDVHTLSSTNPDIQRGDYRPLDLTKPPFNLSGQKIFMYSTGHFMMQVFLICND